MLLLNFKKVLSCVSIPTSPDQHTEVRAYTRAVYSGEANATVYQVLREIECHDLGFWRFVPTMITKREMFSIGSKKDVMLNVY